MTKGLIHKRFSSKFSSYNELAVVQMEMAKELSRLLNTYLPSSPQRLLEIGAGTGFLTHEILKNHDVANYYLNDLVHNSLNEVTQNTGKQDFEFLEGDAEQIALPGNLDVIVSGSTFQWFDELEAFFEKTACVLKKEGILAFTSFGPKNYQEIRATMGVGLDYYSIDELKLFLSKEFEVLYAHECTQVLTFDSVRKVLEHMKFTGVNGLATTRLTKSRLQALEHSYQQNFSTNQQKLSLTYHPIFIIAKRK